MLGLAYSALGRDALKSQLARAIAYRKRFSDRASRSAPQAGCATTCKMCLYRFSVYFVGLAPAQPTQH